ncbi:MAG: methyltransferase [Myxococcales bacterium]|nr:methyltransferase [Myxococcales bacterium]
MPRGLPGASGRAAVRWCRYSVGDRAGSAWPKPGPYAAAALRVPKAKAAFEMALHAAAAELPPDAPVFVYGANDEGIRSLGSRLAPLFAEAETCAARRHCRVWRGVRTSVPARAPLLAWRRVAKLDLPGGAVDWVSYPGLFADGRLDPGTAALLRALPEVPPTARVLDFACGAGAIAAALVQRAPGLRPALLDADAVALQAAAENVPTASGLHLADGLIGAPAGPFDLIVSNPPIHRGKATDLGVVGELVAGASERLAPGGALWLVVQRQVPLARLLGDCFAAVEVALDEGPFRVWSARCRT